MLWSFNPQASYEARLIGDTQFGLLHICFNPQASYEARLSKTVCIIQLSAFQSTGLIRGPTALLEPLTARIFCFNPQASYEARRDKMGLTEPEMEFQSTGLIRGPTQSAALSRTFSKSFNPQASYEARRGQGLDFSTLQPVSIHRPHTRPDAWNAGQVLVLKGVSIHRPHTRPDKPLLCVAIPRKMFQSTGLIRGPTKNAYTFHAMFHVFQSTGLIRGPTSLRYLYRCRTDVSIHRPHTRPDDDLNVREDPNIEGFQSTGLIRGPTYRSAITAPVPVVSIHRPHTRPDLLLILAPLNNKDCFNPQASYEARRNYRIMVKMYYSFNPQASYEARLV